MKNILFILQNAQPDNTLDNLDAALTCAAMGQQTSILLLAQGTALLFDGGAQVQEKLAMLPLYGIDSVYVAADALEQKQHEQSISSLLIDRERLRPLSAQAIQQLLREQHAVFRF